MKSIALLFYGILLCLPLSHKLQAQCQTSITALNTAIGNNGTATITTVTTGTTNPMFLTDNWQVTPGTTQNNQNGQFQFFANGTYTVCLTIIDSLYGCISNEYCTHVTISNLASSTCHAAFTAYTDSNCVTHFQNTFYRERTKLPVEN
ncbi:MAG: hypothetical protein K0R26_2220 [Bacteroidota bacterium]|jgi:hypothetical protein|nr:hypothetical protein [Bacteroidota bacterium]